MLGSKRKFFKLIGYITDLSALTPLRCAADLAWLLQSPPLLSVAPQRFNAVVWQFDANQTHTIAAWLTQLDVHHLYAAVMDTQPKKAVPMRLGRYAETLMLYFLQYAPLFDSVAANVPLRFNCVDQAHKDHTTVGEIDYLLRDNNQHAWHWELAVKFYVCQPQPNHAASVVPHDFKGPAGVDTLGLKLGKMFDKQLQHQPPAPYNTEVWQPASYTRGYLFYSPNYQVPQCDALNPAHGQGWWLTIDEFSIAYQGTVPTAHYVCLPRLYWLARFNSQHIQGIQGGQNIPLILSHADMVLYLRGFWAAGDARQAASGQLLACVEQRDNAWVEVSRGFVLPQ